MNHLCGKSRCNNATLLISYPAIRVPRAEHVAGELQRMNLVEAKLRQAVALKNDVIDGLKDGRHGEYQQITYENSL